VSEESITGAPGLEAGAPGAVPPSPPTAPWLRQTSLRVRVAAAAVVVAVIVPVMIVVSRSSVGPAYSRLPAPCGLVSLATVARYLPDPTRSPESMLTGGAYQAGSCRWASTDGGEDRTLVAEVFVFGSSSALTAAQQAYNGSVSAFGCHCQGVTVSTQPVAGLGDQAAAFFIADGPAATVVTAPNAAFPGTSLLVRASNAEIALNYDATDAATGTSLAPAAGSAPLTGMISVARGILAALAEPAAVASVPVSAEPHYTGSPDPCLLISAATLATYAPHATAKPQPAASGTGSPRMATCSWGSSSKTVLLTLSSFPDAASARQNYEIDAQANSRSISGETVTGSVWMPDLGEEATAIFQTRSGSSHGVAMIVWSGNAEISLWYAATGSAPLQPEQAAPPDRATLLAGGIAMARDVLAALAR
jgi:hypothetical protein